MGLAVEALVRMASGDPERPSFVKFKFFSRLLRLIRGRNRKHLCPILKKVERLDLYDDQSSGVPETGSDYAVRKEENGPSIQPSYNTVSEEERPERPEGEAVSVSLKQAVKQLHFGFPEEKCKAAVEIQRLAKQNIVTRKTLAVLGVIPSLVAMLGSSHPSHRLSAVQALIELSAGNYTNKSLIVEAGAVEKLARLMDTSELETQETIAILVLAISAVDKNKPIVGSSSLLPALITLLDTGNQQGRMASLAALYNLSSCLDVVNALVMKGSVTPLLKMTQSADSGERALAVLGNLVVTKAGREALESSPNMPRYLIAILGWEGSPKCQELASYVLMILAHQSLLQRKAMIQQGIIPVLLELALLGTALAQKRAMRILHWLRSNGGGATLPVSGPVIEKSWYPQRKSSTAFDNLNEMEENKMAIKKIVRQSLQRNMDHIVRRADCVNPSRKLKSLINSSSSKSLPY
eukprot:TRINITY_DN3207_c0_g1_i1.p1 TRINITY_DN3207_c0_g1~~TRINITY_DN3207_c0_g1_i1.p1  ORF type:complete len:465 (-),score=98.97 TRINITY_DN3207_c0_g1_i1:677-2071(-)